MSNEYTVTICNSILICNLCCSGKKPSKMDGIAWAMTTSLVTVWAARIVFCLAGGFIVWSGLLKMKASCREIRPGQGVTFLIPSTP